MVTAVCLTCYSAWSQVTIGSGEASQKGALLDIKNYNPTSNGGATTGVGGGGLLLPRVNLVDTKSLEPFLTVPEQTNAVKSNHKGLLVYNINSNAPFQQGQYIWNGSTWIPAGAGGGGADITAKNGLEKNVSNEITLGGKLEWNTEIEQNDNDLTFSGKELNQSLIIEPRLQVKSGRPGDGKVLTSDKVGNSYWGASPVKGVAAYQGITLSGTGTIVAYADGSITEDPLLVGLTPGNAEGQVLIWNNSTKKWVLSAAGGTKYTGAVPINVNEANREISLNDKGVTTGKIADGAVQNLQLAANAVTTDKIQNGTILGEDIAGRTIGQEKLGQMGATTTNNVMKWDGSNWVASPDTDTKYTGTAPINVNEANREISLNDKGVTTGKIADGAVQNLQLAADAVTTGKILNGTILGEDIANRTIGQEKLGQMGATTTNNVMKWDGSNWVASPDNNTTYTGVRGIGIAGTEVGLPAATSPRIQLRWNPATSAWAPAWVTTIVSRFRCSTNPSDPFCTCEPLLPLWSVTNNGRAVRVTGRIINYHSINASDNIELWFGRAEGGTTRPYFIILTRTDGDWWKDVSFFDNTWYMPDLGWSNLRIQPSNNHLWTSDFQAELEVDWEVVTF